MALRKTTRVITVHRYLADGLHRILGAGRLDRDLTWAAKHLWKCADPWNLSLELALTSPGGLVKAYGGTAFFQSPPVGVMLPREHIQILQGYLDPGKSTGGAKKIATLAVSPHPNLQGLFGEIAAALTGRAQRKILAAATEMSEVRANWSSTDPLPHLATRGRVRTLCRRLLPNDPIIAMVREKFEVPGT